MSPFHALVVTNMYPTVELPSSGTFVAAQVESLRDAGVEVDVLLADRAEGRSVYRGLGKKVNGLVSELHPDLVHVMYGGVMAEAVTRAVRSCPVVVSFCGTDLLGGKSGSVVERLGLRYGVVGSWRAARRAAGIIVKSRNLFDALPSGIDTSRAWIVPNGVDFTRFRPMDRVESQQRLGWDPGRLHVLFPAQTYRVEKRYWLAEASVDLVKGSGLPVDLHAFDGVPHADVPHWLNAANAVVLTSTHEGSPNVVKEALACNVAVVSVDVGDVRERLTGIDGCFLADSTPEDIARKLAQALRRPRRIASREVVADLALERVAARVSGIYGLVAGREAISAAPMP